jgi:hypothetical protein
LNSGSPRSRRREQPLRASLLGSRKQAPHCPLVLRVALDFGSSNPLRVMERVLGKCGFKSAEETGRAFMPEIGVCICRESTRLQALIAESAPPESVLRAAVILGHSTPHFFDPARPLIWTRAGLERHLELFNPARFYEA